MPDLGLKSLTLASLVRRCASETERYFARLNHNSRYCFELFRRAILGHNQCAWANVYAQYQPLVSGWVRQHPAFANTGEEVQYFVNRAFEKMWLALNPERFARFPNLKSLLRYLQMCVHSTIVDVVRAHECPVVDLPDETLASEPTADEPAVEHDALDQVRRQEFWREIEARLNGEQERRVVYGSFVLGLKPSELYDHYPHTFRNVQQIYRIKENLLARLRRDSSLETILEQDR